MVRIPLTAAEIRRGQKLGAALRAARGSRTMVEIASRASISVETLRKIETGRSPSPEFFTVVRICSALGITTDELSVDDPELDAVAEDTVDAAVAS